MNTRTVGQAFLGLAICAALAGCASTANVVSMGNNTYTATRVAPNAFSRDTAALTARAKEDAARFCAAQGKQMKVVDVIEEKPFFSTGYAKSKVVFKTVAAGDTGPAAEPAPAAAVEAPTPAAVAESPAPVAAGESAAPAVAPASPAPVAVSGTTPTDSLYNELLKLDDLRKRGILTEEEFQAEKKKILSRSR